MWSGLEKATTKLDSSSRKGTIDRISTIDGSLASIASEQTVTPVSDAINLL